MSIAETIAVDRGLRPTKDSKGIMAAGFTNDMNGTDSDAQGSRKQVSFLRNGMRFEAAPGSEEEWVIIPQKLMRIPLWRANEMVLEGMGSIVADDTEIPVDLTPDGPVSIPVHTEIEALKARIDGQDAKLDAILAALSVKS